MSDERLPMDRGHPRAWLRGGLSGDGGASPMKPDILTVCQHARDFCDERSAAAYDAGQRDDAKRWHALAIWWKAREGFIRATRAVKPRWTP